MLCFLCIYILGIIEIFFLHYFLLYYSYTSHTDYVLPPYLYIAFTALQAKPKKIYLVNIHDFNTEKNSISINYAVTIMKEECFRMYGELFSVFFHFSLLLSYSSSFPRSSNEIFVYFYIYFLARSLKKILSFLSSIFFCTPDDRLYKPAEFLSFYEDERKFISVGILTKKFLSSLLLLSCKCEREIWKQQKKCFVYWTVWWSTWLKLIFLLSFVCG